MRTFVDMRTVLDGCKPGGTLDVKALRDGTARIIVVKLGEMPTNPAVTMQMSSVFLGVLSEPLTPQDRQRFGVDTISAVVVTYVLPGSPAAVAGLARDDVITQVGTTKVATQDELRVAIQQAGAGTEITLHLVRGGKPLQIEARPEPMPTGVDWICRK